MAETSGLGQRALERHGLLFHLSACSSFSLLTGLLLLLIFCFFPWFDTHVGCKHQEQHTSFDCGGGAELDPAVSATGLLLASRGVRTEAISAIYDPHYSVSAPSHIPLAQAEQFRFPLLWLPGASSLLLLLLPGLRMTKKTLLMRAGFWTSLLALLGSAGVILYFLISAFSAFPQAKAFLIQKFQDEVTTYQQPELSTYPTLWVFLALLIVLIGGVLYLWAWLEERQAQQERFLCRLGHSEGRERRGGLVLHNYTTTLLGSITRPARGMNKITITCPQCHEELTFCMRSIPRLWWYRLRVLATAGVLAELPIFWVGQAEIYDLQIIPLLVFLMGACLASAIWLLLRDIGSNGLTIGFSRKGHTIISSPLE